MESASNLTLGYEITAVGMQYIGKTAEDVREPITLVPEPNNEHDSNAIAVYDENNDKVAYISRGDTATVEYVFHLLELHPDHSVNIKVSNVFAKSAKLVLTFDKKIED